MGYIGLLLLFSLGFAATGVITLTIAIMIFANPGSVAYLIALFLLVYGVSNLIQWYREWQSRTT
ncbi:MAG: hypothetical protein U5K69_26505 [Balneolaceae bacterium]|nr:hypothetical protein [Balneolaceae bacterium]